jgi:hypothetical protein
MPQIRLTAKMAKELKITELGFPSDNLFRIYDDWYWDVTRILRKKIFIFMHIKTRIGLAIPAYEIGGTSGLLECFPLLLREFLNELGYEKIADEAYDFFNTPLAELHFVKTDNKSILRYISAFKFILDFDARKANNINQILCDSTSRYWLKHLIKDTENPKDYTTPLKLTRGLFKQES